MRINGQTQEMLLVFGVNVRKVRETNRISLGKIANDMRYDRGCLSSVEYGEQNLKYKTAVRLAQSLNTSFPALFSRNFVPSTDNPKQRASSFQDDDYLVVFIENIKKEIKLKRLRQIDIYVATGINEVHVNRLLKHKEPNPTIKTLATLAVAVEKDLTSLFTRNS